MKIFVILIALFCLSVDFSSALIYIPIALLLFAIFRLFNEQIFKLGISRFYVMGIIATLGLIIGIFTPLNMTNKHALYAIPNIMNFTYFINVLDANFDILISNIDIKNWFLSLLIFPIMWLLSHEIFLTKAKKNIYLESIRVDAKHLYQINKYVYYTFWILFLIGAFLVSTVFFFTILPFFVLTIILKKYNLPKVSYVPILLICIMFLYLFIVHMGNVFLYSLGDSIRYINSMHLTYGFILFKFNPEYSYNALLYLFVLSVIAFIGEFVIAKNWNSFNDNLRVIELENIPENKGFYIGDDDNGKKIILSLAELNQHMYVNATTGGGKTTLFLRMVKESIKFKMPVIFVDGKGSPDLVDELSKIADDFGVKFKCFSFIGTNHAGTYDFLGSGNSDELRNKLMNLLASKENIYYFEKLKAYVSMFFSVLIRAVQNDIMAVKIDLIVVYQLLINNNAFGEILQKVGTVEEKHYFEMVAEMKEPPQERIINVLTPLVNSSYKNYLDVNLGGEIINLAEGIKNNEIVLFLLDVSSYPEDTEHFGKLIIDDINATFSTLKRANITKPTMVFFDEFGSYASMSIVTSLSTHRSNGLHGIVGSQSLETIAVHGDGGKKIVSSIVGNTNTKIILRSINQFDLELFGDTIGTEKSYEMTHQMETGIGGATGLGSMRIGNKYKVNLDLLRGLPIGNGYIYRVSTNKASKIKVRL